MEIVMNISLLLEELISIAQISKTDLALSLNMTPSGLSKILTGRRLPSLKEKKAFSWQASRYLAESIYRRHCYLKFKKVFPVIYDFNSKHELELFLAKAIEYSLDSDIAAENNTNWGYSDTELCFWGKNNILNMFCIIVSDYILSNHSPMEFYSTLPLFNRLYADIFQRIRLLNTSQTASFNQYFDMSKFEASYGEYNINLLSHIVHAQEYVDLTLWKIAEEIDSSFLLLKGQFLLLFSMQIDGTPLMSFISHKGYLPSFFNALMKKDAKKISYNKNEAIALLETNSARLKDIVNRPIDAVYNFISIGYFLEPNELDCVHGNATTKKTIIEMFDSIMTKEAVFYVTIDAMMHFFATGKVIVPFLGAIDVPAENRVAYLRRFDIYMNEKSHEKIKVISSDLPKVAVLCFRGLSLIYIMDQTYQSEKIHCFETDIVSRILHNELAENPLKTIDFSLDLWDAFIGELTTIPRW